MWKYVSRRIRDSLERGANYFDVRGTVGASNPANSVDQNKQVKVLSKDFVKRDCSRKAKADGGNANHRYWYYDYHFVLQKWFGAISLSGALVVGWYANQFLHLRRKCCIRNEHTNKPGVLTNIIAKNLTNINWSLGSCTLNALCNKAESIELSLFFDKTLTHDNNTTSDSLRNKLNLHLVTNDKESSSAENSLSDVLNSIENRLGLAAIEHGQHKDGLSLLRSAANRNHAPALYNLALCYENGLGLPANEKMAMELYAAAAVLEHPSALYNLAVYYGQGRGGLKADASTAERLLRIAATKGQTDAITALDNLNGPDHDQPALYPASEVGNSIIV